MATMDVHIISGNLPFHVSQDLCPKFRPSVYPRGSALACALGFHLIFHGN